RWPVPAMGSGARRREPGPGAVALYSSRCSFGRWPGVPRRQLLRGRLLDPPVRPEPVVAEGHGVEQRGEGYDLDVDDAVRDGGERRQDDDADGQNAIHGRPVPGEQPGLAAAEDEQAAHRQDVPDQRGQRRDEDGDGPDVLVPYAG